MNKKSLKKSILFTIGTRPEAIKMAPLIKEFEENSQYETILCLTGQHREILDQVTQLFKLKIHYDLNLMKENQSLHDLGFLITSKMNAIIKECQPSLCFVQGDTTTTFATALACFYSKIKVGHIEAGLRSHRKNDPFPEEINRRLTSQLSDFHFTPTKRASLKLLHEGFQEESIFQTGNTIVDALYMIEKMSKNSEIKFEDKILEELVENPVHKIILVTLHRRENFGSSMEKVMNAIKTLALLHQKDHVHIVFPVHPNPNVQKMSYSILGDVKNIHLTAPLPYHQFIYLMKRSYFILSDSGGVQEEAPYLHRPVLLLRNTTERPEGVECGNIKMVGTEYDRIIFESNTLLQDEKYYSEMSRPSQPFGDGMACKKIRAIVEQIIPA